MIGRQVRGRASGWTLVALTLAALTLPTAGCPRHLPVARPYPPPTVAELIDALRARQRAVRSMSARARATSWLGGDRVRATVLMLVDRPGRLRFEAEVSLQGTVAVLATDGRQFAFLDAMKNELRRGPACPANVASLIRIPLAPMDVAAILLGDARVPEDGQVSTGAASESLVEWDADRGGDVLVVRRNDGWLRLVFQRRERDPRDFRMLAAIATGPDGRARWRVAYEDFVDVATTSGDGTAAAGEAGPSPPGGSSAATPRAQLPRIIRFAEGDASFDDGVEIKFKERTLDERQSAEAFGVTPTPGTQIIDVGCPPGG